MKTNYTREEVIEMLEDKEKALQKLKSEESLQIKKAIDYLVYKQELFINNATELSEILPAAIKFMQAINFGSIRTEEELIDTINKHYNEIIVACTKINKVIEGQGFWLDSEDFGVDESWNLNEKYHFSLGTWSKTKRY